MKKFILLLTVSIVIYLGIIYHRLFNKLTITYTIEVRIETLKINLYININIK
jgi:hypothetical protein